MQLYTQYIYEKVWTATSEKDAISIIIEELGNFDPEGTLKYILDETSKEKVVAAGECRFKADVG